MGKLDETNHLLHLFRYYCGKTEVPPQYIDWTLFSAVAAAVQDRVWIEKFAGDKLAPNLYVFLIGESGIGKGTSIKRVLPFIEQLDKVKTHIGPITGAALNATLAGTKTKPGNGKLFLIQEELAYCLGHGDMAFDFIKTLTGIYSPTKKMQKATVTSGHATMRDICINWIAGTTIEWMVKTLPKEAIKGGFVGRIFPVYATRDYSVRVPRPVYPEDCDEIREHLMTRFAQLGAIKGQFTVSKKAQGILDHWYMTRPAPESEDMASVWQRQHDMVYKIAMLFSLCEDYSLRIKSHQIAQAIEVVSGAEQASKIIIQAASATEDSDVRDVVKRFIAKRRLAPETALMRECSEHGISKRNMLSALDALKTEGAVSSLVKKSATTGQSVTWWRWRKGLGKHLKAVE